MCGVGVVGEGQGEMRAGVGLMARCGLTGTLSSASKLMKVKQ